MTNNNLSRQSIIDAISGAPAVVDRSIVDWLFDGAWFIGSQNIIDGTAYQTGMRHVDLDPAHRVFEFDIWSDRDGTERSRVLRTEIGVLGVGQCEIRDYYPDEQGNYRLPMQTEDTPSGEVVEDRKEG